jgi:hypothetical protein
VTVGLGRAGLETAGPSRAELEAAGLGRPALETAGLGRAGLETAGPGRAVQQAAIPPLLAALQAPGERKADSRRRQAAAVKAVVQRARAAERSLPRR